VGCGVSSGVGRGAGAGCGAGEKATYPVAHGPGAAAGVAEVMHVAELVVDAACAAAAGGGAGVGAAEGGALSTHLMCMAPIWARRTAVRRIRSLLRADRDGPHEVNMPAEGTSTQGGRRSRGACPVPAQVGVPGGRSADYGSARP